MRISTLFAAALALALLGACGPKTNPEMAAGWQCTAKDDPGSVPGGPHEYHWRAATKDDASAGALAQCKSHSGYPATCLVDTAYYQPL